MTMIAIAALFATPSFAEPTELDKKTVASKAYVDTKQDKITTDLVTFHEPEEQIDYTVPALVSYGTGTNNADGVLGNKIGILGSDQNGGGLGSWEFLDLWDDSEAAYLDNFVPTVRAVAEKFQSIWDSMPRSLSWTVNSDNGANRTNAINAYNSTFGNGTNQWAGDSAHLINGEFLAKSLALKQNKLPEQDDDLIPGQAGSVLAPTTAGNVTQVALWDADGGDSTAWNIDDYYTNSADRAELRASIPTIGAVEAGLSQKQNKMVCAGWDSETHTDEHCWLWSIAE